MKKLLGALIIIMILGFAGYFVYTNYYIDIVPKIDVEKEIVNVDEYYIYGNHFNIKGDLQITDINYDSISLILYNGDEKEFNVDDEIDGTTIKISTSDYINEGMYIDNLDKEVQHER